MYSPEERRARLIDFKFLIDRASTVKDMINELNKEYKGIMTEIGDEDITSYLVYGSIGGAHEANIRKHGEQKKKD